MPEKNDSICPDILEEPGRVITRLGNSEIIQTRESITFRALCKSHQEPSRGEGKGSA